MVCASRILPTELLQKLVALFAEATHGTHDKRNEISLHYMPTLSIFDGVRAALLLGRVLRELFERKQALLHERAHGDVQPGRRVVSGYVHDLVVRTMLPLRDRDLLLRNVSHRFHALIDDVAKHVVLGLFGRARAEERVMPEAVARPATLLIAEVDDVAQRLSEHLLSLSINVRFLVRRNEGDACEEGT